MPNHKLTTVELAKANAFPNHVRARLNTLASADPTVLFAYRPKMSKELSYDECGEPTDREKVEGRPSATSRRDDVLNLGTPCRSGTPSQLDRKRKPGPRKTARYCFGPATLGGIWPGGTQTTETDYFSGEKCMPDLDEGFGYPSFDEPLSLEPAGSGKVDVYFLPLPTVPSER